MRRALSLAALAVVSLASVATSEASMSINETVVGPPLHLLPGDVVEVRVEVGGVAAASGDADTLAPVLMGGPRFSVSGTATDTGEASPGPGVAFFALIPDGAEAATAEGELGIDGGDALQLSHPHVSCAVNTACAIDYLIRIEAGSAEVMVAWDVSETLTDLQANASDYDEAGSSLSVRVISAR